MDVLNVLRGRILVGVPPGGPTRVENHRRDTFAIERKALTDRHLLLRPTVVVAGEQSRRTVGLIPDQTCVGYGP